MNGKRVAIYARYSSRFQHSIDDQVRVCREWSEERGLDVRYVFADEAVTGKSSRRKGLAKLRQSIENDEVDIVVVFTTNRLYRKMYQSLQFVEEEIVDAGKRCVFVQSGIDTADSEAWRQHLQVNAMIDEFLVQTIGKHVNAAHVGLMLQRRVFGTLAFGYTGEEIAGQTTRLGRPVRRIVIDPISSEWVRKIFTWLVHSRLTIRRIVQRLNDLKAPLHPKCRSGQWTRVAVRKILENRRYVGDWSYGKTKSVWLNKKSYRRQIQRDAPLRELHVPELRIIDDVLWAEAQEKLTTLGANGGRRTVDGVRKTRPRILNGMLKCKQHNQ
ncbi:MAG: recombinase family protein [Planctomycetaceae bacterium]|nr:recombinase family protein [Planctomycetaceae bacterium]